jgi:transposase
MVTIGVDPHKQTHTGVAADGLGTELASRTVPARREGFGQLLEWGRTLDQERVWVIEDVRHVSGGLERFLLDRGETVVRLAPRLMADARRSVRERGKSDPIDALAIARAALREGVETLPTARLSGSELEIRLLGLHRERLVGARTRMINELRWQLHDLWPEWELPPRALIHPTWQVKVSRRLARAERCVRVQIARDMIRRVRELTQTIAELRDQLAGLVAQTAPALLAERGVGVLLAAKFIGEIAGVSRFQLRRATRAPGRMRTDPGLLRTYRPPPVRPRWQPPAQPCVSHARRRQAPPRPPGRRLHRQATCCWQDQQGKRSAVSNANSSAASTTSSRTPTASPRPSA